RPKPMVKNKRKILRVWLAFGLNFIKSSVVANYQSYVSVERLIAPREIGRHRQPSLLLSPTAVKQLANVHFIY
ncbi:MAG TPA: hypothetical protein VFS84_03255, partial [Candidatus Binatia bacterium]|nr:hypothetical protein [Candidatus Binatia bacterium]